MNTNPPTFIIPRFENTSHFSRSLSLGSGLCSQSSFSISSGNSNSPAEGIILYFSDTVCVLTLSSKLPALEGALESSNGEANGEAPCRLSLLPPSELQLVLLEDIADTERDVGLSVGSSWYGRGIPREREGGSNISEDSATPGAP